MKVRKRLRIPDTNSVLNMYESSGYYITMIKTKSIIKWNLLKCYFSIEIIEVKMVKTTI